MEFLAQFHPKIVHFPIALLLAYTLFEILTAVFKKEYLSKGAHLVLLLGVLGALAAVLTGNQAEDAFDYWNKASSALMEEHETWANITLWYFSGVLVLRTLLVLKKKIYFKSVVQSNEINDSGSKGIASQTNRPSYMFLYLFVILAALGSYFVFQTGEHGGKMVYKYGVGTQYKIDQEEKP